VIVGTVRVVDETDLEWHSGDPAMIAEILARGVSFTPEELAGRTREHHLGSETEPELVEVWFEPNTVVQPHAHHHDEIIYVVAGSLILGSRVLNPGSSVFIAGRTLYSFRAGPEGVRFANFRPRSGAGYLSKDEFMAQRGAGDGDDAAVQPD
jgi:quercetin dioxygenase-like cupin family protein